MNINAWLDIRPAGLTEALLVTVFLGIASWCWQHLRGWVASLNDRWSLRWCRNEQARFRSLLNDPATLQRFLLQQMLWIATLLGIALMFSPLGHDSVGVKMLYVLRFAIGGTIYVIGIHALGTVHHLAHQPERTLRKLAERITELEKRNDH